MKNTCEKHIKRNNLPFIYLFKTNDYNFVLDLHTNRLFSLTPTESKVLEKYSKGEKLEELLNNYPHEVSEIINLQQQGLFCCVPPKGIEFGINWQRICDKILHERTITIIEITQQCNLRCKYCTFGGGFTDHRTHSSAVMDSETIINAVESAFTHSDRLQEISIGFYGGEPLCAFEQLKTAVLYAQNRSKGKRVRFSMTTNATLIDKQKACFLRDAGFSVLVSIDGPKYMHDRYRIFPDGKGSYCDAITGLKTLLDVYPPNLHHKIGLNMVIPSLQWLECLEELWDSEPWIPKNLRAQATRMDIPNKLHVKEKQFNLEKNRYKNKWLLSVKENTKLKTTLGKNFFDKSLTTLHQRPIFSGYRRTFFPNGCCIPAVRKIYVRVDGTYQICERVHGVPPIGSLSNGINFSQVKQIIDEYCHLSFHDCKDCWAISNCSLCYQHAYENCKFNIVKKRKFCESIKSSLAENLKIYGVISNKYPYKIEEWDKIEIK